MAPTGVSTTNNSDAFPSYSFDQEVFDYVPGDFWLESSLGSESVNFGQNGDVNTDPLDSFGMDTFNANLFPLGDLAINSSHVLSTSFVSLVDSAVIPPVPTPVETVPAQASNLPSTGPQPTPPVTTRRLPDVGSGSQAPSAPAGELSTTSQGLKPKRSQAKKSLKSAATSTSTSTSLPSPNNPLSNGGYHRDRPLRKEHWQMRENAIQEFQSSTSILAECEARAKAHKESINILYFRKDDVEPQSFSIVCKFFPHFCMDDCSPAIRKRLDIEPSDSLFEMYEYRGGQWSWGVREIHTMEAVKPGQTLLYRSFEARPDLESMDRHEQMIRRATLPQTPSRKRPFTQIMDVLSPVQERSTRPRMDSLTITTCLPPTVDSSILAPSSPSDTPCPSPPTHTSSLPPPTPVPDLHPRSTAATVSDAALRTMPMTEKKTWPLKYVCFMAEGFAEYHRLEGIYKKPENKHRTDLAQPNRFALAFPGAKFIKSKWNTYYTKTWVKAPQELLDQYIEAGATDAGLWKSLCREMGTAA
ncbi:hypothetical protein OF83DRAFT_23070 [Amylostereum chailletii]|nr:hypothetical protein OF83DRAFT_23070 [Amylostereum chailletii]